MTRIPSVQRGHVVKREGSWGVRWYDENGNRRRQGGFETKSAAREWVDNKVAEVAALRRGDRAALARSESVTVSEAVDRYLAAHEVDVATTEKLRRQLRHATAAFGARQLATLRPDELAAWRRTLS